MFGMDAPWHWFVLAVLVVALFGYKRLPDATRAIGRSLRIFRTEVKGLADDGSLAEADDSPAPRPVELAPAPSEPSAVRPHPRSANGRHPSPVKG